MILLLAAALAAPGCRGKATRSGSAVPPKAPARALSVSVLADPVLAEPLGAVAKLLKKRDGTELRLSFLDSTAQAQLKPDTAPAADVLIFADHGVLSPLVKAGVVDEASACVFAGDRLTLVGKRGMGWRTETLFDTYRLRFKKLGLADSKTVLGAYCDEALKSDGAYKHVKDRLKYYRATPDLAQALAKDEVQLAMAYASTAAQDPQMEVALLVGADLHEDIRYRAVARAGRSADRGVQEFLRLLCEDQEVQAALGGFGLADRETALTDVR